MSKIFNHEFLLQLSSVHHFLTHLVVTNPAATGVPVVSSRCARLLVVTDLGSHNLYRHSTHVVRKDSGDQLLILPYHWFILLAHVRRFIDLFLFFIFFAFFMNCESINVFLLTTAASPAQRVFKISMLFPSSVLCNDAGQGVLRQKVRSAINQLNRDWNFCSYAVDGTYTHYKTVYN